VDGETSAIRGRCYTVVAIRAGGLLNRQQMRVSSPAIETPWRVPSLSLAAPFSTEGGSAHTRCIRRARSPSTRTGARGCGLFGGEGRSPFRAPPLCLILACIAAAEEEKEAEARHDWHLPQYSSCYPKMASFDEALATWHRTLVGSVLEGDRVQRVDEDEAHGASLSEP
jgi:hypothetical protein